MMDSGRVQAPMWPGNGRPGADFTFMGRSFMYSVAALGDEGGDHVISMLKTQLMRVMDQICCEKVVDLPKHIIK